MYVIVNHRRTLNKSSSPHDHHYYTDCFHADAETESSVYPLLMIISLVLTA